MLTLNPSVLVHLRTKPMPPKPAVRRNSKPLWWYQRKLARLESIDLDGLTGCERNRIVCRMGECRRSIKRLEGR